MNGERHLHKLLADLCPRLSEEEYVFLHLKQGRYGDYAELSPVAVVAEAEGLTLVVPKSSADSDSRTKQVHGGAFRRVTLEVHSSLEAVGLTAVVSGALAARGISANMIAGCFHDHLFVPAERALEALQVLRQLSEGDAG